MGRRRSRWVVTAVAAECVLVVAACGRPAGRAASSGNVSPTKGLVATTPAGTKPVPSVTGATDRDMKSLDPNKVFQGPGWSTDAFVVSSFKGALDDLRARRALSLALDRQAIIGSVYKGAALMPRWLSNPGTFGYGQAVFTKAYDSSPVLTQNLAEAKKLIQRAGTTGKTITIGTVQPTGEPRRGDRRLPGGGAGDRAEGGAEVGSRAR